MFGQRHDKAKNPKFDGVGDRRSESARARELKTIAQQNSNKYIYIYIYIHTYLYTYTYIYTHTWGEEGARARELKKLHQKLK